MRYIQKMKVYKKVALALCWELSGRDPIMVKWFDINKGDEEHEN
jgi:hypothetical protein